MMETHVGNTTSRLEVKAGDPGPTHRSPSTFVTTLDLLRRSGEADKTLGTEGKVPSVTRTES